MDTQTTIMATTALATAVMAATDIASGATWFGLAALALCALNVAGTIARLRTRQREDAP